MLLVGSEALPNDSIKDKAILRHFVDELGALIIFRQDFIEQIKSKAAQDVVLVLFSSIGTEVKFNGIHGISG
jgi:hypothetical protein